MLERRHRLDLSRGWVDLYVMMDSPAHLFIFANSEQKHLRVFRNNTQFRVFPNNTSMGGSQTLDSLNQRPKRLRSQHRNAAIGGRSPSRASFFIHAGIVSHYLETWRRFRSKKWLEATFHAGWW